MSGAWDKNSDTGRKRRARERWWWQEKGWERENTWRMTLRDEISRQNERRSEQKYARRKRRRSILQPEYRSVFFLSEICWLKQRMLFNCVVIVCWCRCGWDCCGCACRCWSYGAWGSPSLLFWCRLCSCLNIWVPVCQGLLAVALKIRFFGIYLGSLNPQLCEGFCFLLA